ncbi:hypothetical protein M514_06203 [Trichuris suis]|uniref:HAT C-terminal dimerisation domain-containing protein n=1 Tax=Trichuris suis TaxID=68888 RepID=A0A085NFH9_9BILA|nr:hypothetical protein M513_06203 [Trichuris suis]KFD68225.1 hypothetical protein M514_06203 [Trichuris suis]
MRKTTSTSMKHLAQQLMNHCFLNYAACGKISFAGKAVITPLRAENLVSKETDRAATLMTRVINVFSEVFHLFEAFFEFFEEHDVSLGENLKKFQSDIAYLCDLYSKFNEMNLLLQGDDLNLIGTKTVNFLSFQIFVKWKEGRKFMIKTLKNIAITLELLHRDFSERFEDIIGMEISDRVLNPFSAAENAEFNLQELIELQTNEELKIKCKNGYQVFWLQPIIPDLYPGLWAVVRQLLVAFPSSYLAERGFSVVTDVLRKNRNRLQITKRGDLRSQLTSMQPNVDKLVSLRQTIAGPFPFLLFFVSAESTGKAVKADTNGRKPSAGVSLFARVRRRSGRVMPGEYQRGDVGGAGAEKVEKL